MDTNVSQEPLLLITLGFSLAMAVVTAIVVAARASRPPILGLPPIPTLYPADDSVERLKVGCLLSLLFIAAISILLALFSA